MFPIRKPCKVNFHPISQLNLVTFHLSSFRTDPALPPPFFHSLETQTTHSKEANTSLRLEDSVKRKQLSWLSLSSLKKLNDLFADVLCSHSEPYNKTNLKH